MKHKLFLRRAVPLLALTAIVLANTLPTTAFFLFSKEEAVEPAVESFSKNGLYTQTISFTADDFKVAGEEYLDVIIIDSLPDPSAGVLTMGSTPLSVGDVVALSAMDGLRFSPLAVDPAQTASFSFVPVFLDGTQTEAVEVELHLLTAENHAPVAQQLELSTYKNVAITERFVATDSEGDILTFQLVDKPARGSVTMPEDGSDQFVYTPYENKTGKDSFSYVAIDAVGNTSEPVTVKVQIEKADTKVTYADMEGDPAHKAAIRLAEEGIYIGAMMEGQYFFQPDAEISRSEFTAMAMAVAEIDALEGVIRTGFADDEAIPTWAKPYISSALKAGVVQGSANESGQIVFDSDSTITGAEATVLLDRALQVTDVVAETGEDTPTWAAQAVANLSSSGVLQSTEIISSTLTRGEAAQMLCGALELQDSRDSGGWFNW